MFNQYFPRKVIITKIKKESADTNLYDLIFVDKEPFEFSHGQFVMSGLTGFGEAPFDICGKIPGGIQLAIRKVGKLTEIIHNLKKGDYLEVRGPYGNSFPKIFPNTNLLVIGGGCGFITFRAILDELLRQKEKGEIKVFFGASNEDYILFRDRFGAWKNGGIDLDIILDNPSKNWRGRKGVITELFKGQKFSGKWLAFLCGPPIMYRFVVKELKKNKFANSDILLSFERRMHCGVGACHHCACGGKHICRDGPIFNYKEALENGMI